jgi:hypothetical protein
MIKSIPRMSEVGLRDWLVEIISGNIGHLGWTSRLFCPHFMVNFAQVEIEDWKTEYAFDVVHFTTMMVD